MGGTQDMLENLAAIQKNMEEMKQTHDDLLRAFAYYIDCQLATLDDMCLRKSASKSDKERHRQIAQRMLFTAVEYNMNPELYRSRQKEIMDLVKKGNALHEAVDIYMKKIEAILW